MKQDEDYRKLINSLDRKLSVYEKLGTPKELAEKLGVELPNPDIRHHCSKVTATDLLKEGNNE